MKKCTISLSSGKCDVFLIFCIIILWGTLNRHVGRDSGDSNRFCGDKLLYAIGE